MMTREIMKKGLCGICPSGCGVEITMEGEQLRQDKTDGRPSVRDCLYAREFMLRKLSIPLIDYNSR